MKGSPSTFVLDFEAIKGQIERKRGWQAEGCEEMHLPAHCQGVRGPHSTDLAVIEVTKKGLVLKEVAPGWTAKEIQALTEAKLIIAKDLKEIELWLTNWHFFY